MAINVDEIDDLDDDLMASSDDQYYQNDYTQDNEDQDDYEDYDDGQYEDGHYYGDNFDNTEIDIQDSDVLYDLLMSKGINPDAVQIQNADGQLEVSKFEDLSKEEQLQLLDYNEVDDDYGLDAEEVSLINYLRSNNISAKQYVQMVAQNAVNNYAQSNQQETFEVDSLSDDELFILDLTSKIPDISDDEAWDELETAKSNEYLYEKKIQSMREEYKQKEDLIKQQEYEEQRNAYQQQAAQYEQIVLGAIQRNETIDLGDSQLTLSVDDKNELASFILDTDGAGVRYIAKALNDPHTLVNMAWYALKGKEAFAQITDYYKQEISKAAKYNYNKGYEDARKGHAANSAKVVVKKAQRQGKKPLTINDID